MTTQPDRHDAPAVQPGDLSWEQLGLGFDETAREERDTQVLEYHDPALRCRCPGVCIQHPWRENTHG